MFDGWSAFFGLLSSAAAALTGLLFVVVSLSSGIDRDRRLRAAAIYMSPIVLNFAVVLTSGAFALAPQRDAEVAAPVVALSGAAGLAAAVRSVLGLLAPRHGVGVAHWSDAWCYGIIPGALYIALIADGAALEARARSSVLMLGVLLLALLLAAIRNAWDLVTWMGPQRPPPSLP